MNLYNEKKLRDKIEDENVGKSWSTITSKTQ